ncbi:MAG: type III restriction endonuclease subunit R, partial [Chloroflexota bacterium]|nr:type III restriction endonuclease subunit R [Chloroflexota bacterium]
DKSNMGALLFDGFQRCLFPVQKFDSDTERILAVVLDRDAEKWFRPATRQFQIEYRDGHQYRSYQPDFVAELNDRVVMIEIKARNQMDDPIVLAKRTAAVEWCMHASNHAATYGGKPWQYALIPHDAIHENWDISKLLAHWTV